MTIDSSSRDEAGNFTLQIEQASTVDVITPNEGSGPRANFAVELSNKRFSVYLDSFYPKSQGDISYDKDLTYNTSGFNAINQVAKIRVTSPGIGYQILPEILGLYHREIDRGEFKIVLDGG